jgi:hypothetical protein
MPKILIFSEHNSPGADEDLLLTIQKIEPDSEITKSLVPIGPGGIGPFWDRFAIFLVAEASKVVIKRVTEAAVQWAKDRMKQRDEAISIYYISIFGPDGIPLTSKNIQPSGEVRDSSGQRPISLPVHLL